MLSANVMSRDPLEWRSLSRKLDMNHFLNSQVHLITLVLRISELISNHFKVKKKDWMGTRGI